MIKLYGFVLSLLWKFFPRGSVFTQMAVLNRLFIPELPKDSLSSVVVRPSNSSRIFVDQFASGLSSFAIVVQGKIREADSFEIESIYIYRKLFPQATIIVSTWVDSPADLVEKLRAAGVHVLLNDYPSYAGFGNFNLQMKTSREGLLLAKNLGFRFAIKVRSDQRITSIHAIDYMRAYLQKAPLTSGKTTQNSRLGFISLDSFAFRIYGLSDMLHFGDIDDLLTYWSGEEDSRVASELDLAGNLREYSESGICEVRLFSSFLASNSWNLQWTLEDYWNAVVECCIIIDSSSIDLFWPKYSILENKWHDSLGVKYTPITNAFWMRIGETSLHPNESILDQY